MENLDEDNYFDLLTLQKIDIKNGSSSVDQRKPPRVLELSNEVKSQLVLWPLVQLGHPQPTRADQESGSDAEESSRRLA